MPIIDLTLPRGVLPRPTLDTLARDLIGALLHCDLARGNPRAEAMNWVYIHTHDPQDLIVGGPAGTGGRPRYRVDVTLMAGAMREGQREEIARSMTAAVLAAEGGAMNPLNAARVWVLFHEIPDGHWAAGGRLYRLDEVKRLVAGDPHTPSSE
jgi:phenylpyruvate tautomerase PptA (4-oxalocrotonate tautomerase family)